MSLKVCIIGNDGAGKSTLAQLIQAEISNSFNVVSFATELKQDLYELGIPTYTKPYSVDVRGFVRSYGDLMRSLCGLDYWANRLLDNEDLLTEDIVVDDMRYWSELELWTQRFGKATRVITVGPIQSTTKDEAQSVVQVNEMLRVLRADTTANMLHLPDIKKMSNSVVLQRLQQYLK